MKTLNYIPYTKGKVGHVRSPSPDKRLIPTRQIGLFSAPSRKPNGEFGRAACRRKKTV